MWGGMPGRGRLGIFKPLGAPDPNGIQWIPGNSDPKSPTTVEEKKDNGIRYQ